MNDMILIVEIYIVTDYITIYISFLLQCSILNMKV